MRKCYLSKKRKQEVYEARKKGLAKGRKAYKKRWEKVRTDYENDPKLCFYCKKPMSYEQRHNKFCSHSCSAVLSNLGTTRHGMNRKKKCQYCGKITNNTKYCSKDCQSKSEWEETKNKIEKNGFITVGKSNNPNKAKKYLAKTREHKCEICGGTEWMEKKIPLVLDHINGIPTDWRLDNLRRICGNCNMQTDTFAGKNKNRGKGGRPYRMKRYYDGKSW